MPEKKIITKSEKKKLQEEYRELIDVKQVENTKALALARSQGDLSENADYTAARDEGARIKARIEEIEHILNHSIVVEENLTGDEVSIGSLVTFINKNDDQTLTVKISGSTGSNPFAETPSISNESPLGRALLGKKVGDIVSVSTAEPYDVEITKIGH